MARTTRRGLKGGGMTRALGQMVGLLLSLYVFDEVIDAIVPSIANCPTGYTVASNSTISAIYCNNATASYLGSGLTPTASFGVFFDTAITFVGNLFPVIGILGAFEIIYSALKRAGMV